MKKIVLLLITFLLFFINCWVFASDKKVTLSSWWNVFSTSNLLSDITFSNKTWSWLYFFALNNWKWEKILASTWTVKPLDWFMVYNKNKVSIDINLEYKKNLSQNEALFSKKLTPWWNLVWLTTSDNPFSNIIQKKSILVDFTWFSSWIKYSIYRWDLDILNKPLKLWKAYLIYMTQAWIYNWSQDLLIEDNSSDSSTSTWNTQSWSEEESILPIDQNSIDSSPDFSSYVSASMALNRSTNESILARYDVSASYDDLKLTDLYLYNKWSADLLASIKSISLYDWNWHKLAWWSILGPQTIYFSLWSNSSFIIPRNTSNSTLTVAAVFNDITDSSQTNKTIELAIWAWSYVGALANWYNNWAVFISESNWNYVANTNSFSSTSKSNLLVRSYPIVSSGESTYSTNTFMIKADNNNRIEIVSISGLLVNPINWPTSFILYKDWQFSGNEIASGALIPGTNWEFVINFDYPVEISAWATKKFILVYQGTWNTSIDSKRIFRIIDLSYYDMMDTGTPNQVLIPSINSYYNVWLPTIESTYIY